MKTAFELANSDKPFTDRVLDIKEYAKQVAEQALKDAAKNATVELVWEWDGENEYQTNGGVDKDSILSTPIVTP